MCAGALLESHLLGIGRPFWTRSHPKLPLGAQGATNGPTEPHGNPRGTKVTPRRAPWEPKAPQRLPKGSPKLSKESKMNAKDIPMRPTNHKTIYTQAKYTQTPDPPPYSGRLVCIYNHIYIYIYIYKYVDICTYTYIYNMNIFVYVYVYV